MARIAKQGDWLFKTRPGLLHVLPAEVRKMLKTQPTNAWVSFTAYDADMTKVIPTSSRQSLETAKKATKQFAETVRDAKNALK